MKFQYSEGFLPYEIGDTISLKNREDMVYKIEDIRFIQYLKNKKSEFEVQLSLNGLLLQGWFNASEIRERVKK